MAPSPPVSASVRNLLTSKQGILLDIGCGSHKTPGALGMDSRPLPGVDLVWNLQQFPWPLPDACAHSVVIAHVWEHLPPWVTIDFMNEVHRVCRPDAKVFISGPYGLGFRFVQDPTHCNPVNDATFAYWDPDHISGCYAVYRPKPFKLLDFQVIPAGSDRDYNAVLSCVKPDASAKSPNTVSTKPSKSTTRKSRRAASS